MSEENNKKPEGNQGENKVDMEELKKIQSDMMRYKQEKRELAAKLDEIEKQRSQEEKAKLEEQGKFKDLAAKHEAELVKAREELQAVQKKQIDLQKLSAFKDAGGELARPHYSSFVDLEKIVVDATGDINVDSAKAEVERLKKDSPEIFKSLTKSDQHAGQAPFGAKPKTESGKKDYSALDSLFNQN